MADKPEQDKPSETNEEAYNGTPEAASLAKQDSSLHESDKDGTESIDSSVVIPYEGPSDSQSLYIARVNPGAIDALARNAPEQFLTYLDTNDKRLFEFNSLRENNRHREETVSEDTKRIALGVILVTVISVLVFAGVTGDGTLAKDIMTILFVGLGGIGIGNGLRKPNEND